MHSARPLLGALATRPNQFVETSRALILARILGIKFTLASGSGQTTWYVRNNSSRLASHSLGFCCFIALLGNNTAYCGMSFHQCQ
jgi:hypothetical protein